MIIVSGILVLAAVGCLAVGWGRDGNGLIYTALGLAVVAIGMLLAGIAGQRRRPDAAYPTEADDAVGGDVPVRDAAELVGSATAAPAQSPQPFAQLLADQLAAANNLADGTMVDDAAVTTVLTAVPPGLPVAARRAPAAASPPATSRAGDDALLDGDDVEAVTFLPDEPDADDDGDGDVPAEAGGIDTVMVVNGRPRYHRPTCRYVAGESRAEALGAAEALHLGFTPCRTCRPDGAAALEKATTGTTLSDAVAQAEAVPVADAVADVPPPEAPSGVQPAVAPARGVPEVPVGTESAETAAVPSGVVAVIPNRSRFHRPECPTVAGAADLELLSRDTVMREGFLACTTCRP